MERQVRKTPHRKIKKKSLKKKLSKLTSRLIILSFVILVIVWLGLQAFNFCVFHAIRTVDAQPGELAAFTTAQGVLLLQEEIVRAPAPGKMEPLVPEGMRVFIGGVVASLEPLTGPDQSGSSIEIKSPATGIVCYHLDGWEGVYDRLSWERSDPSIIFKKLTEESNQESEVLQKEGFSRGDPVFKIIDNLVNPYLIIQYDQEFASHLKVGKLLQLSWEKEGDGEGRVISLINKGSDRFALLELEQAHPFPCQRLLEFEIKSKKGEGVIIPVSALVKENDKKGVYVMSVLGPVFKKVDVTAELNDRVAVQGISPGAEVVKNPGLAKLIKKDI
ncbi:MAG: HlyD family efflux transporter periplasmic adaptor subunit [Syntrophaceticus sp.]